MEITGVICAIYATQQITEKFRKRVFVLELCEEYNGITYTDYAVLQALNSKCDLLDHEPANADTLKFIIGDRVKVVFGLAGTQSKNGDYFNNLTVKSIIAAPQEFEEHNPPPPPNPAIYRQPLQPAAVTSPVHPYNAPPTPPMAKPLFPGTPAVPQGYQANYTQSGGIDDLPF